MKQHGGWLQRPEKTAANHARVAANSASAPPRGFRHYRLADRDQPAAERDLHAVTTRAQRLELRMNAEIGWEAPPPALDGAEAPIKKTTQPDNRDNPYIPSGYTYFSQFVAHDMVATRVPFWATAKLARDTVNDRGTRLQLDSLYGGGPTQNPIIYAAADPNDLSRAKLQVGKAGPLPGPDGNPTGVCPFRDIARLKPVNTLFDLNGLTEALVADPRNDDHALISQLTMVFCHLHNIFVDRQAAADATDPDFHFTRDTAQIFENARTATTLIYRRLIRDDLLKRLLHPAVYALYTGEKPPRFDQDAGNQSAGIPLEFSHGAFRFGHAMVRETYQVNQMPPGGPLHLKDGLERFSSARNSRMQPMPFNWLVKWSNFFFVENVTDLSKINLSRRIGPRTPLSLFGAEFNPIDSSKVAGLMYRDLISAELGNLWGVDDLLAAIRRHPDLGPVVESSPLLKNDAWRASIRDWLPRGDFSGETAPWAGVDEATREADFNAISSDPLLPFFVLFEACKDPESLGCRLGRFGSILVADTLFGELNNKMDAETASGSLLDQLKAVHPAFADDVFGQTITMGSVIGFVDACLKKSDKPEMKTPPLL